MANQQRPSLEESLSRISEALARRPPPPATASRGEAATALGALGAALTVAGLSTGHHLFLALGLALAAGGGALFGLPQARRFWVFLQGGPRSSTRPSIGVGTEVGQGALVEPGALVEIGATIGRGAVVRSGAVVRMGATVSAQAVIERGATVSWGAEVETGAVVGENAIVGAGSTVREGAHVPAGMRISPGSIYSALEPSALAAVPQAAAAKNPRDEKLLAVCDRLEAEMKASPEHVRAFLGGTEQTIRALRRTCEDISRREGAMREEVHPLAMARLEEERAALQKRIAENKDLQLGKSLQGAAAAIDDLKRQRDLLKLGADRLEAEHSRLLYTLEGIASQFVRLRTVGPGAAPELEESLSQLRAGIDAIADALEETSRNAPAAMSELGTGPDSAGGQAAEGSGALDPPRRIR